MVHFKKFINVFGISLVGLLILMVSQLISSVFYSFQLGGAQYILQGLTYVSLTYFLLKQFINRGLRKNLSDFYLTPRVLKKEWVVIAILLPLFVLLSLVVFVPGKVTISEHGWTDKLTIVLKAIFTLGIGGGIAEELIFRGLILVSVTSSYGRTIGIVVPSIAFGALHVINGNLNVLSFFLLLIGGTLVAILFSLLAYGNRSIWASAVVHAVWNTLVIGNICNFGIKADGNALANYVFTHPSSLLTGGEFGVEVSIIAIAGYVLAIVYLLVSQKSPNPFEN